MAVKQEDVQLRIRFKSAQLAAETRNVTLADVIGVPKSGAAPSFEIFEKQLQNGNVTAVVKMLDIWDRKFAEYTARTRTPAANVPAVAPLLQGVPVQKPEGSTELLERFTQIKRAADAVGLSVDQAAEAAKLGLGKWDESALLHAINSSDENERRTASELLKAWQDATRRRLTFVKQLQGVSPKDVPPAKSLRLRPDSIEELRGIDGREDGFIALHNRARGQKPALTYSHELALSAQAWADHLISIGDKGTMHNLALVARGIGQNMAWIGGSRLLILEQLKDSIFNWVSERASYDPDAGGSKDGRKIGHYTQLVWKSTTKVGCGLAGYRSKDDDRWRVLVVCDYSPAGNVLGQFKDNV